MPDTLSSSESSESAKQERPSDVDDSSSISGADDPTYGEPISRKRKFKGVDEQLTSKRQPSLQYYSKYHDLYNATVKEVNDPVNADNFSHWRPGRIGLSYWSVEEKEAFFVALDRKGRDNIKGISSSIGSKSELEVRSFVLDLQEESTRDIQDERFLQIPAAFEISEQCEEELNSAAIGLARRQLVVEEEAEQKRHGDWWLLDHDTAKEIDTLLNQNLFPAVHQNIEPAARLFNVVRMTALSSQIFMNSKDMDDNWTTWLDGKSGPGIYGTALVDLYNLVVEITRRAVASAIFLKDSRYRLLTPRARRKIRPSLKYQDMKSACDLLGLNMDLKSYWVGVPRRCNLDVYERQVVTRTFQTPLSYDEVEQYLARKEQPQQAESKDATPNDRVSTVSMTEGISTGVQSNHLAVEPEEADEESVDRLDIIASRQEETRLWKAIGENGLDSAVDTDEDLFIPSTEIQYQVETAKDWRREVEYKPLWQSSTGLPPETLFSRTMDGQLSIGTSATEASSTGNRQSSASDAIGEGSSNSEAIEDKDTNRYESDT